MAGPGQHTTGESRSAAGGHNPWLIAVVVSIATFMQVLDTSIANVALRHIAGSLAAGLDESTWVITTYLVANAVIIPVSGWLSNVVGRKRFYMICVAIFTAASLLCGLAQSLGMLIFFRILQGLGGGGMAPSEQSILADTFPPEKRAQAFALYAVAVIVAPTVGPTLGGWITDNYSWNWIFFINVPVGGRVSKLTAAKGGYAQTGQSLMGFVPHDLWVTANFKETQLTDMRPGQGVDISIDAYPDHPFRGHVDSLQAGSGAAFSLLPPENATGNYVKVVQRVPVKIVLDEVPNVSLGPGMSVAPRVRVR